MAWMAKRASLSCVPSAERRWVPAFVAVAFVRVRLVVVCMCSRETDRKRIVAVRD